MTYLWAGASDVGRVRLVNEDAVLPNDLGVGPGPVTVAIADGLGGHPGGDVASRLAIDAIASAPTDEVGPADLVQLAHERLRAHIATAAEHDPSLIAMSTTLTLAILRPGGTVHIGHVGDSRAYRWDQFEFSQVTTDHTVAMDLVRMGRLDPEEASHHPGWHRVSNVVGWADCWVETHRLVMERGDRLLLCSDGLSNMLDDTVMEQLVRSGPPEPACQALIVAGNDAGGLDNISVVVVLYEG